MRSKVLSLGQCAADNYALTQLLENQLEAEVVPVSTYADAVSQLRAGDFALVLVNRILDADGASGLACIDKMLKDPALKKPPIMLVSNHADAQKEAVALGALPGFGKAALRDERTLTRLRSALKP